MIRLAVGAMQIVSLHRQPTLTAGERDLDHE